MDVGAYLHRIRADRSDTLEILVRRHLEAVPFETLSIHLGEAISLRPTDLYDKIVVRRRGGFCHELNGLFGWLLAELGHEVALLGARVAGGGGFTAPLEHAALRVLVDGRAALVDVGFGRFGVEPVALDELRSAPDGDLDVLGPDGSVAYRLDPRPRRTADFVPTCFWQATSPDSFFTHGPVCSLPVAGGRATLSGRTMVRTSASGERWEQELSDPDALAAYRDVFGIELDRLPVPLHPVP